MPTLIDMKKTRALILVPTLAPIRRLSAFRPFPAHSTTADKYSIFDGFWPDRKMISSSLHPIFAARDPITGLGRPFIVGR